MFDMSMEIYVLSNKRLSSFEEWQQAINRDGFQLTISRNDPIETHTGYLPARWQEKQTGFECSFWDIREIMEEYPAADFRGEWTHALAFRWGADLTECCCAYAAATAYAAASGGVVFDPQEGLTKPPDKARETARKIEAEIPMFEANVKRVVDAFSERKR
jgi:hypothetical protein